MVVAEGSDSALQRNGHTANTAVELKSVNSWELRLSTAFKKHAVIVTCIVLILVINTMMEIIVFGSFFVLSFVALAFNHLAKGTEQQRQSVSNLNFIKFQRSFFFVFFLALLGDWLQGPYVYKLYNYYGYQEHQIATLYVAGFASRYK